MYKIYKTKNTFTFCLPLTSNKSLELELSIGKGCCPWSLFKFNVEFTSKTDHSGFNFWFQFLKLFEVHLSITDNRHWNQEANSWEIY